jgi:mono/diheme cytochrome c family protein
LYLKIFGMKSKIVLAALSLSLAVGSIAAPPAEEGKTIFLSRCASCHNVNKLVVGPALAGVDQRRSMDWIVKFVQSSQALIQSGDKDAVALFAQFNNIPMPDHKDLSAEHVQNIVAYIKGEAKPVSEEEKAPFAKLSKVRPAYLPLSFSNYGFFLTLFGMIALLIGVLLAFVRIKEYQRSRSAEKG